MTVSLVAPPPIRSARRPVTFQFWEKWISTREEGTGARTAPAARGCRTRSKRRVVGAAATSVHSHCSSLQSVLLLVRSVASAGAADLFPTALLCSVYVCVCV